MAEKDQGAKAIIQLRLADIIVFALPGAQYLGPLATDVATEPQLVLDTLHRIRYHGIVCAANIELQATPDKTMPRRLYEYGSRASIVHKLPIISIVIWLHTRGAPPVSPYELRAAELLIATWHFHSIEVRKLSASAMITSGPLGLLPFVPFMQGASEARIEQAMRRVKAQAPAEQVDPLAFIMAVFTAQVKHDEALARGIVRKVFHMSYDIFKDSPLYQTIVEEAAAKARREMAQAGLEGRFGPLPEDILQALSTADEATLKAALSSDTLVQVRERLDIKPQA
jgi:hypothetical protein